MPTLLLICFLWLRPAAPPTETQLRAVLAAQAAAWNRGDVAAYMRAGYWVSDSLVFVGGAAGPTYGYAATLARYRKRYPDAARMGRLTFTLHQVRVLPGGRAAFVVGGWALARTAKAGGPAGGAFTLLFERKAGHWVIVADHSS